ncbi:MAG TPA: cobamide remodeling phosphodiesterase CbiR [Armatimonadota bacterium]|jgi:sugar phosphate isomerase/epimerase
MTRPFRLGATSCVYENNLLANVRKLAPLVDDIELVLYDVAGYGCNFPGNDETRALATLAQDFALSYTVHLPMDVFPGDASLALAQRAIAATRALGPHAYILHFDGRLLVGDPSPDVILAWQAQAADALAQVLAWVGEPQLLCVENLELWNPRHFDALVARAGVSRCVDVGHLWLEGHDPLPYLAAHQAGTRVIHAHGFAERDHGSLCLLPEAEVSALLTWLARTGFCDVLTLEVFSEDDLFSSLRLLDTLRARVEDAEGVAR